MKALLTVVRQRISPRQNFLPLCKFSNSNNARSYHLCCRQVKGQSCVAPLYQSRSYSNDKISTPPFLEFMIDSKPVIFAQESLIYLHEFTNLPWWLTIVLTTAFFRSCITLPLTIYQMNNMARFQKILPELEEIKGQMRQEAAFLVKEHGIEEKQARLLFNSSFKKYRTNLIIKHNCHPMKSVVVVYLQVPFWISLSLALRGFSLKMPSDGVAESVYYELMTEGLLWIPNLTIPDSTLLLPIILTFFNLSIIEIHAMRIKEFKSKLQRYSFYFMRGFTIILLPISATLPSCLPLYWTTSSLLGLLQNLLLMSPKFQRKVLISHVGEQSETPYRDLYKTILSRLSIK